MSRKPYFTTSYLSYKTKRRTLKESIFMFNLAVFLILSLGLGAPQVIAMEENKGILDAKAKNLEDGYLAKFPVAIDLKSQFDSFGLLAITAKTGINNNLAEKSISPTLVMKYSREAMDEYLTYIKHSISIEQQQQIRESLRFQLTNVGMVEQAQESDTLGLMHSLMSLKLFVCIQQILATQPEAQKESCI